MVLDHPLVPSRGDVRPFLNAVAYARHELGSDAVWAVAK